MLSPSGRGKPGYLGDICGGFDFAFPTLRNLTKSLVSRAGTFDFFGECNQITSSPVLISAAIFYIVLVEKNQSPFEVRKMETKKLLTTHFQNKLM